MNGGGPDITDAVGLGVLIAQLIYAPPVASIVGPYITIVLAAVIGASFAVSRHQRTTRLAAAWYFFRVGGLAMMLTGGIAGWAGNYYEGWTERALIAPVALLIGSIGDDFPALARWALAKFVRGVDFLRTSDAASKEKDR